MYQQRKYFKNQSIPSIIVFPSEDQLSKHSCQDQYDEQPTVMLLGSNRQSFNNMNRRNAEKFINSQKKQGRILTYESDLMQSSPQKSQSSAVDREFVGKYLTPIKKQQTQALLFTDQIKVNVVKSKGSDLKLFNNKKTNKIQYSNIPSQANESINQFKTSHKNTKMIKSFMPCVSLGQQNLNYAQDNGQQKICECKNQYRKRNSCSSVFVDQDAQIYFLKSNNKDLYNKLTKEIQKNKILEVKIDQLSQENRKKYQQNQLNIFKINKLTEIIKKFDKQRKDILAKQWHEFQLVKDLLIERKRSKSRQKHIKNQNIQTHDINQMQKQIKISNKNNNQKALQNKKHSLSQRIIGIEQVKLSQQKQFRQQIMTKSLHKQVSQNIIASCKKSSKINKQNFQVQKILIKKLITDQKHKEQVNTKSDKNRKKTNYSKSERKNLFRTSLSQIKS